MLLLLVIIMEWSLLVLCREKLIDLRLSYYQLAIVNVKSELAISRYLQRRTKLSHVLVRTMGNGVV